MKANNKTFKLLTKSGFITMIAFGTAALLVMTADLMIPVYGETIRIDPREIFVTLGAALTGPIGGLVIGAMAHTWVGEGETAFRIMSLIVHVSGGVWMGVAYKKLVYQKLKMPWFTLGWAGLIVIYYAITLFFFFVAGSYLLFPAFYNNLFNNLPLAQAYWGLATAAIPEFAMTLLLTTVIMLILPPKYRRPLW